MLHCSTYRKLSTLTVLEALYVGTAFLALFAAGLLPAPAVVLGLIGMCAVAVALVFLVGGAS